MKAEDLGYTGLVPWSYKNQRGGYAAGKCSRRGHNLVGQLSQHTVQPDQGFASSSRASIRGLPIITLPSHHIKHRYHPRANRQSNLNLFSYRKLRLQPIWTARTELIHIHVGSRAHCLLIHSAASATSSSIPVTSFLLCLDHIRNF